MPSKNKNSFVNMSDKCLPKSNIKNVNFKPTYRCKVCKNSFKKFLIFEGHFAFNVMCRAKNGWIIQCYVCGQKFRYLSELKYHMGLHKIQKNKSVEQTDTRKNEGAVNGEHGNSRANDFRCTICQRKCRTKLCLNKHMLSHSKDVITKESSANGDLHAAIPLPSSTVTSEVPKTEQDNAKTVTAAGLKCETCNLPCTTEISLKLHQKFFHQRATPNKRNSDDLQCDKRNNDDLQCDICFAKFTFSVNLKRHRLMHTNGDLECEICQIKFTKMALARHKRKAHPTPSDAMFKENLPEDKTTKLPTTSEIIAPPTVSENHASPNESKARVPPSSDIITPPIPSETTTPPIVPEDSHDCGKCGKSFPFIRILHMHIKTHRKYVCWICGRRFNKHLAMHGHARTHQLECYICKTPFRSKEKLLTHMRKHPVYEQWIDPATVYLSNWNPEESREILLNQPLVMVERLNVFNLTSTVVLDKPQWNHSETATNELQIIESDTDVPPAMNDEPELDVSHDRDCVTLNVKYSKNVNDSLRVTDANGETKPDLDLLTDNDEIMFFEPDTTTDNDNVIDVSSESDIDEMELYHCYFCNETFRTLHALGVHVPKCSFCP